MSDTVLSGFSIKNILGKNNKNSVVNNLFSKYKIENENDKANESQIDKTAYTNDIAKQAVHKNDASINQ